MCPIDAARGVAQRSRGRLEPFRLTERQTCRTSVVMSDALWTEVLGAADLPEATLTRAALGDAAVLLYRSGGDVFAIAQRCTHAGMPLDKAKVASGILTCPAHGSQFRLEDGRVVRPPAQQPLPTYEVREVDGGIQLRPR